MSKPEGRLDERFSDPKAGATSWSEVARLLDEAELYWLTTVRADGRPHVTPLVGVFVDGELHFCTGLEEQKARNLEGNPRVAMTTGNNTWAAGLDAVVEGTAVRITDAAALRAVADAFLDKYGDSWRFDLGDGVFTHGDGGAAGVFRIEASKVLAFAKDPHAHTSFRF